MACHDTAFALCTQRYEIATREGGDGVIQRANIARVFTVCAIVVCAVLVLTLGVTHVVADDARIISGFSGKDTVSWLPGDNVSSTKLTEVSFEQGGNTYARSCLEAIGAYAPRDSIRAVCASFTEPLDLSEYLEISFDIYAPVLAADSDAVFFARLTLVSENGDTTEHLEIIEGGRWNHVEAYIGSWEARARISEAEIAVAVDTSLTGSSAEHFYVDDICVSDPVDRDMTQRFLFDSYRVEGGSAILDADKSKISMVSEADGILTLEAEVFAPKTDYSLNCLRLRFANNTASDTLTLHYSTTDSQVTTEDKIVTVPIKPYSGVCDYLVFVGDAAQLQSIKLIFNSAIGEVELVSINAISAYEPIEYTTCGRLNSCTVSEDLTTVTFSGEVNRETAIDNRNGHIAIFAHEAKDLPTAEELSQLTPLVETQMTTRFELMWRVPSDGTYGVDTRFIAVSVAEDGEYSLICAPFYIQNADSMARRGASLVPDAKAFASNDISAVSEVGASLTLLELDTQRLFVEKSKATAYIYRGKAYYFDGEYLKSIASKADVLGADGVQVLLRIYGWKATDTKRLNEFYANDTYVDYSKVNRYSDGSDYIAAIGAYIAENFVLDKKIVGVVYGDSENIFAGQNSLSEMVDHTADCLRTLYFELARVNPDAKLYVSLTDLYRAEEHFDGGEVALDIYLPALIEHTAKYGQFPWELSLEKVYRVADSSRELVSVDTAGAVRWLLENSGASDKHIIFVDHTYFAFASKKIDNVKNYVLGTYGALFCDYVDAYIAATGARAGEIVDSVKYIFTDKAYTIENIVKMEIDIDDFAEVISKFDAAQVPKIRLVSSEAGFDAPKNTLGSFSYYRFDSISSIGGLSPSYYSGELRVTNDNGNVLSANLDASQWGDTSNAFLLGIGHNFDITEDLSLTPILAITLKINASSHELAPKAGIKVVLKGEGERFEAAADVPVCEWTTIYIDTSGFKGLKDTKSLQIFMSGKDVSKATLKIKSIDGLSSEYDDESLARVIEKTRQKKATLDAGINLMVYWPITLGVVVAIATVVILVVLSKRRYKENE